MKIERSKFFMVVIVVLVLINIATLATVLLNRPKDHADHGRGPEGPKKFIIEKLHFNKEQVAEFDVLVKEHQQQMRELREQIFKNKEAFYDQLKTPDADTALAYQQIASITKFEEEAERITFNHFKKVRAICNEEQKLQFDLVIKDILNNMMAPHGPHHGPMDRPPGGPAIR